jgi:alpha-galactosidase
MRRKILWEEITLNPAIQLKHGVKRELYPLHYQKIKSRDKIKYENNVVNLSGKWDDSPKFGSLIRFRLKNISHSSLRITRLVFPVESGLDKFLKGFNPENISFYRNGYQSWSLARSYKLKDKPLRSWLQIVSLVSSNMANLPSNNPGNLSSEMFAAISDLATRDTFFVGQSHPFHQFFYIRFIVYKSGPKKSHFELVYDFGRKMLLPGETIELDSIIMARGDIDELFSHYFSYIKTKMKIKLPGENLKGWSSWYYYYKNISYNKIIKNLNIIDNKKLPLTIIQIDDGYEQQVGDWLEVKPSFKGRMKELADTIKARGYIPGIWIAPFAAARSSLLVKEHPEYVLRNEYGIPLPGGFHFSWPGGIYYGLDITHPRYEEYLKKVITTIVHEWGYEYLKLDFMYCACLRGGTHRNLRLSRPEVLQYGLKIIKEVTGDDVIINGCGMPFSPGIGLVDSMRIGPDTAPQWYKNIGIILRSGIMSGVKDSIRNNFTRSMMNRYLWINDPDCLMLRHNKTKLKEHERLAQIDAAIITGGALFISDDLEELPEHVFVELDKIVHLSDDCFAGRSITLDLMETGLPGIIYNTSGYLGIFNMKNRKSTIRVDLNSYPVIDRNYRQLKNVWTDEKREVPSSRVLEFEQMIPHSSFLFHLE